MKIDNIKTMQEFYVFADVWYQRTHKLREIWQDESQATARRERAHSLFKVMLQRVMKLVQVAIVINQPKPRNT